MGAHRMPQSKGLRRHSAYPAARLKDLLKLAEFKRDQKMHAAAKLASARAATLHELDRLSPPMALSPDDPTIWRVTLQHNQWTEALRTTLNLRLARQTGAWLQARDGVAKAVGQYEVLHKITKDHAG